MEALQAIRKGLAVALLQPLLLFLEAPAMIQILNLHGEIKYASGRIAGNICRKLTIDKVWDQGSMVASLRVQNQG